MKIFNPDFKFFYKLYRKLPIISAIAVAALSFVFSMILVLGDVISFTDSYFLDLVLVWIIGAIITCGVWFFSMLTVSATIIRTDSVIEINEKLNSKDND